MTPRATLIEAMQDANDPTDALDRMLAAMKMLGLKVVPVEATQAQDDATRIDAFQYVGIARELYARMIAAAPNLLGEET